METRLSTSVIKMETLNNESTEKRSEINSNFTKQTPK